MIMVNCRVNCPVSVEVVHPIDVSLLCAYSDLFRIYLSDCACPCIFSSLSCLARMRVWASSRAADVGRAGWGGVEQCCEFQDTLPHTLPDLIFFVHFACFKASPTPPVRRGRSERCPSSEDGCESRKVRREKNTHKSGQCGHPCHSAVTRRGRESVSSPSVSWRRARMEKPLSSNEEESYPHNQHS